MTILRDISFLWSMLHVIILFLLLFQPRFSWRRTLIVSFAGAGVLLVMNVLLMAWLGHGIIMSLAFFTCTIPSMLLFFFLSEYRDGRFFFLFCLTDTVCFWLLQVTNFLDRLTGDGYAVMLVSRLLVFPAVEYVFWRCLRRPYLELQAKLTRNWWLFAATGAVYYLLIMFTAVPVGVPMPDAEGLIRIILVLLLMPLTYLTILRSLWRQMQLYEDRRALELQRQSYSALCQKLQLGRIYRHDMRHHMLALEGMLQRGDSEGAREYVQELSGRMEDLTGTVWCANSAVNAVLAGCVAQGENARCSVAVEVRLPEKLPYSEMDLCVLLANVLENAINACRDLPDGEGRVELKTELTDNQRLILSISNTCPKPVALGPDGLPVPARQKEGHGVGLQSVKTVIRRYGGVAQCQWQDGVFSLRAVLFPPQK